MTARMDITNKAFGRLIAIEISKRADNKRSYWICQCECGNSKEVMLSHLRSGATQSCGCLQKEKASKANTTHGARGTSLYDRWKSMKQRCENPNNERYNRYGGRGIVVCHEWQNFEEFKNWSHSNGYSDDLTIDRKDNDKSYTPENCRWVSYTTNGRNREITVRVEGLTLGEIAEKQSLLYRTIHYRYYFLLTKNIQPSIESLINYQYDNHEPS